ncbi:YihA family ribosome biogenesis GTP-binding protein [Chlorobaculum sp. 24CR]|uniref:ribosome biogenesis GTP-binding protein YihA/YsxC n=1 Tax=Chlorobaculum sp. 24CR TaxID=2508878 RepID=UPI00100B55A9|nr:ribosome biogenesis GTP-binding protein YihA/YsxC [Chlorobaculum sp. 24CR]RXK88171.1 YihA family ribosome biogenesis GTP-binding protein [Chlorobaculum sp. 24CR]
MNITSADFFCSYSSLNGLPSDGRPEMVFVGRSNVGKSSLLNSLCVRRGLAKTSSTPGKTRLINYFLINDNLYFVDLPGYGYAKVGQGERESWGKLLTGYIQKRTEIALVVLLVDSRHPGMASDLEMMEFLDYCGRPFGIVLTKWDKLKQAEKSKARRTIESCASKAKFIVNYSSLSGSGRDGLLASIDTFSQ